MPTSSNKYQNFSERLLQCITEIPNIKPDKISEIYNIIIDRYLDADIFSKSCLLTFVKRIIFGKNPGNISCFQQQYWMCLGYSEEEAVLHISKKQVLNNNKFKEKKTANPEQYSDISPTQKGYWLKLGLSEEDATLKVSDRQKTFTLEKCIEKYGEKEGKLRYQNRQSKWIETLKSKNNYVEINKSKGKTYDQHLEKHGKEFADRIHNSRVSWATSLPSPNEKNPFIASKESLRYFIPLMEYLKNNTDITDNDIFIGYEKSREFQIRRPGRIYSYDFCILKYKIILEFHGIAFHPKSLTDNEFKHPFGNDSTEKYYLKDLARSIVAIEDGFKYIAVFSDEDNILDKLKNFCIININNEKCNN